MFPSYNIYVFSAFAEDKGSLDKVKGLIRVKLDEQFAAQKSDKEIEEEMKKNAQKQNPVFALLNPAIQNDGHLHAFRKRFRPAPQLVVE